MGIDYSSDAGRVRLLIPDTDETAYLLEDDQITAFLALEVGVKRAAALALETIASNEAMVGKVIRTQDLATDGAKVSSELRARAAGLRRQADDDEDDAEADTTVPAYDFPDPDPGTGFMADAVGDREAW